MKAKNMAKENNDPYIVSADDLIRETSTRSIIPCSLSLDIGLGGGIPLGSTVLIGGKEKLGKTTLALQIGANAQRLYGAKLFFYPIEGRLTSKVLKQIRGIKTDLDNFQLVRGPAIKDESGKVVSFRKMSSEWWFELIGQNIMQNHGSVHIVDSLANLMSEKQISEEIGYEDRGKSKTIDSAFCRRYGEHIIPNKVTLIFLTQIMANTGQTMGNGPKTSMKVSNSIKFQSDVIMLGKWAEKWKPDAADGAIGGHNMHYEIQEAPNAAPFTNVAIPLKYGFGIDFVKDTIDYAVNFGFIIGAGAWFKLPFYENEDKQIKEIESMAEIPDGVTPIKIQGNNGVRAWFVAHPEQLYSLESRIRKILLGSDALEIPRSDLVI
jgi:recombination protein RecA